MVIEGKYIYCIIKESDDKSFGSIGINNREVSLLHCNDMAAVISSSPIINFDRLDKKELTRQVAFHQKVNEQLMKDYDVVPMSFGIIAPSAMDVNRILRKAYFQFEAAFEKIERKMEFAVQIFWDEKKFLAKLADSNQEIKNLKEEIDTKGSIRGMGAKLKLGKIIFDIAEKIRKELLKEIKNQLKEYCSDFKEGKLIDKTMIGNISFLINKSDEPVFDKKMQELGEKYEKYELSFKYVGPMPAYSFVNINFNLGNFEIIDEARKLLGLDVEATIDEIKKAYRALAHQYHPDKRQDEQQEEAQDQMKKISQAYHTLEHYCQGCYEFMGQIEGLKYSFREKDVKDSIM
ncbi:MAG: GvpL/GvpF family gas vesicle protein [bacterium]